MVVELEVPQALHGVFRFKPGQHLPVRATIDGVEQRRSYSICGAGGRCLRIAIKHVAGGRFSPWAHASLAVGQQLEAMPPSGRFLLAEGDGSARHLVAFAAGVGITPIIAILRQALAAEPQTRFTLVYGNRTPDSSLFVAELEDLKDRYLGRFTLISVVSRSGEGGSPLCEGRITGDKVAALARALFDPLAVAHFYICGPGAMIGEVRARLIGLGVPRARIHHEFFAPAAAAAGAPAARAGQQPQAQQGDPPTQAIAVLDGLSRTFPVPRGAQLVDAALAAGIRVPYSCKGGMCCTCRARLVEGRVEMRRNYSLEPWELARGFILTCQAVPLTERVVVDYDSM
jgi:ring-1,2-phenylacetyl-CoA epoxidase subunit PaaE